MLHRSCSCRHPKQGTSTAQAANMAPAEKPCLQASFPAVPPGSHEARCRLQLQPGFFMDWLCIVATPAEGCGSAVSRRYGFQELQQLHASQATGWQEISTGPVTVTAQAGCRVDARVLASSADWDWDIKFGKITLSPCGAGEAKVEGAGAAKQAMVEELRRHLEPEPGRQLRFSPRALMNHAAMRGELQLLRVLLEASIPAEPASLLPGEWTPLQWAAFRGHADVVEVLLEAGAAVSSTGRAETQRTALHLAAQGGCVEAIHVLLAAGANMHSMDGARLTPLHLAVGEGGVEAMRELLQAGADVNRAAHSGFTPLHLAAAAGRIDTMQVLLQEGASANSEAEGGFRPLHVAALNLQHAAIRELLASGADVAAVEGSGGTALQVVLQQGLAGAQHDFEGAPLKSVDAVYGRAAEAAQALVEGGASPACVGAEGRTALHVAAAAWHADALRALIAAGADAAAADEHGDTALHTVLRAASACAGGDEDQEQLDVAFARAAMCVWVLLAVGADRGAANKAGDTPLSLAAGSGIVQLQQLFFAN